MVEYGLLIDFLVADKVKVELLQVNASVELNDGAVFMDAKAVLLVWVLVFPLVEWSDSDSNFDGVAIALVFVVSFKDVLAQRGASFVVHASIILEFLINLIIIIIVKIENGRLRTFGLNFLLLILIRQQC